MKSGQYGENELLKLLETNGFTCNLNKEGNLYSYDVIAEGHSLKFTAEVKFDMMESRTGNVAIEYFNSKKCQPSGIDATSADYWVFVLQSPQTIWITKTAKLQEYIKTQKPWKDWMNGGDGNACFKLYKREEIFGSIFSRIDNMSSGDLVTILKGA